MVWGIYVISSLGEGTGTDTFRDAETRHPVGGHVPGSWEMEGQAFEGAGRVSFILSFFCVTSIKTRKYSTHTNRHKSPALYLQLWLAPAHLASCLQGGVGEGVSHIAGGGGNKAGKDRRERGGAEKPEAEK